VRVDRKKEFTNVARRSFKIHEKYFSHKKNDFAEGFKILLDTDLKIILSDLSKYINKFCWNFKNNAAKSFDILATGLSVLHNYFDNSTKLFF